MEYLDSDLLRTFVAVAHAGSVTEGAERIHRSQSATSIQIKRLEAILGHRVFERHGRGVIPTEVGQRLLPVAIDVTSRLDATLQSIANRPVTGKLAIGIPDDHGRDRLAQIVADFGRRQPGIALNVTCSLSTGFPDALRRGELDIAVYEVETVSRSEELLMEDPTCWVSASGREFADAEPLPVALFDEACWWRDAAISSLEANERPYRIVYSSQSVQGILAAIQSGMAVGLVGKTSLRRGLEVLADQNRLGPTPTSKLVIAGTDTKNNEAIEAMRQAIRTAFQRS